MLEAHSEQLLTLAEIAVAFAGFSALVSVLGRRPEADDPRADSFRLRVLVETALIVASFSLLPIVLSMFPVSDDWIWRAPSVACIAVGVFGSVVNFLRLRSLGPLVTRADQTTKLLVWPLDILQFSLFILVAAGIFPQTNDALYFAALYVNLIVGGIMFLRVAGSVLAHPAH